MLQCHSFQQIYRDNVEDTESKAVARLFFISEKNCRRIVPPFWQWLALCVCIHMRVYRRWMCDSCVWLSFITPAFHSYYSIENSWGVSLAGFKSYLPLKPALVWIVNWKEKKGVANTYVWGKLQHTSLFHALAETKTVLCLPALLNF